MKVSKHNTFIHVQFIPMLNNFQFMTRISHTHTLAVLYHLNPLLLKIQ